MKPSRWLLPVLGLLLAAGLARLGAWQLARAQEKTAMLAQVQSTLEHRQAVPLARAARAGGYDWSAGPGRFLAGPVMLLDNQRRGDAVGVHVLLPFQPDQGGPLLVDLGWLPLPADRQLPQPELPQGGARIAGLLAPPTAPGLAIGSDHVVQGKAWLLTRIDLPALSRASGLALAPRVLRLDPQLPMGFARDLQVLPNTLPPERHRGYAVQWFGLSFAVLAITVYFSLFRRRP